MAIKWSPGCRCCGPQGCDEFAIGFTPLTEQIREGYPGWKNFTEYLQGDKFSHYSNIDGRTYLYIVPTTLFSGSGWTFFEESRYDRVRRVDVANEVDEWHMYGSGWAGLTEDEIDSYLSNGRLGSQMGYVSKNDVLPSSDSWALDFDFDIIRRGNEFGSILPPFRLQLFSNLSVALNNAPDNGLVAEYKWAFENERPPGTGHFRVEIGTHPNAFVVPIGYQGSTVKSSLGSITGGNSGDVFDVGWSNTYSTEMRKGVEPLNGFVVSEIDMDSQSEWTFRDLVSPYLGFANPNFNNGMSFFIKGAGLIRDDSGKAISVQGGDLVQLHDKENYETESAWTLIYSGDIALTDYISAGLIAFKNAPNFPGRKVGIYVADGQQSNFHDVQSFSGVSGSRTRTPIKLDCPKVFTTPTPCSGENEKPVFMSLQTGDNVRRAADMLEWVVPALSLVDSNGIVYPFQNQQTIFSPWAETKEQITPHPDSTIYLADHEINWLGNLGSSVHRTSVSSFEMVTVGIKERYYTRKRKSDQLLTAEVQDLLYVFEHITAGVIGLPGYRRQLTIKGDLFAVGQQISNAFQGVFKRQTLADFTSPNTDLQDDGWNAPAIPPLPESFWGSGFLTLNDFSYINPSAFTRLRLASGEATVEVSDADNFDCRGFVSQGSYDVDWAKILYRDTLVSFLESLAGGLQTTPDIPELPDSLVGATFTVMGQ